MLVGSDPIFFSASRKARRTGGRSSDPGDLPVSRLYEAGGLIGYDPDIADAYRQSGVYAGKILRGALPADLPIQQPTKFQLVINLRTAKALGIEIPPTLLARADDVI